MKRSQWVLTAVAVGSLAIAAIAAIDARATRQRLRYEEMDREQHCRSALQGSFRPIRAGFLMNPHRPADDPRSDWWAGDITAVSEACSPFRDGSSEAVDLGKASWNAEVLINELLRLGALDALELLLHTLERTPFKRWATLDLPDPGDIDIEDEARDARIREWADELVREARSQ